MAFLTADVIPVTGEEHPYKVVFKHGNAILAEWLVETVEDGEAEILEAVKSLMEEDDDDGDDDDKDS